MIKIQKKQNQKLTQYRQNQKINPYTQSQKTIQGKQYQHSVVHLGNAGFGRAAWKTRGYAKKFPKIKFTGIDTKKVFFVNGKWEQIKADFVSGLKKLENNSKNMISTEMALGYYGKKGSELDILRQEHIIEYTRETIKLAHQKLVKGGKLLMAVDKNGLNRLKKALENGPFNPQNVEVREMPANEAKRTFWLTLGKIGKLYQITATK